MNAKLQMMLLAALIAAPVFAQPTEPKVKVLATAEDYAYNSPLAGDGAYEATITVGVPAFGRDAKNKDLWTKPVTTKFHFKLAGGKLIEVTEPAPEPK